MVELAISLMGHLLVFLAIIFAVLALKPTTKYIHGDVAYRDQLSCQFKALCLWCVAILLGEMGLYLLGVYAVGSPSQAIVILALVISLGALLKAKRKAAIRRILKGSGMPWC